jgi:predicted metalloprotease with PDZ domain
MTFKLTSILLATACALATTAAASPGPAPAVMPATIPQPRDVAFPGVISLSVDASDIQRRIIQVRETLPVTDAGEMVLLYPQWLPGTHAPEGAIDRFAGLKITADGKPVAWTRDTVNVFAFHVRPPAGARTLEVEFQFLPPPNDKIGAVTSSASAEMVEWISLVLYPAGYYTRDIPVDAALTLPEDWSFASALERQETRGQVTTFRRTPLNTLGDSPAYAGRWAKTVDLSTPGGPPVRLNLFADRPESLEMKPEQIAPHKALVEQAQKLFGSHHYDHYDFLLSLSDNIAPAGLEHHQSSEDGASPAYFTEWDKRSAERDLLAHEYTHSWNGKFRRPADLWTPNWNTPMRDSLLWVYEGQTEYWGWVLAARSGLFTREQALDELAMTAADESGPGRVWRPLQDTTNDEIINPRRPEPWASWQRFEDYYVEGALIWLDADTLIRERSGGKRSLDDFARRFFGVDDGSYVTRTYTFDDVVAALNAVEPYDWATFLRTRLDSAPSSPPLDGFARGGYRLVYDDQRGDLLTSREDLEKATELTYSVGFTIEKDGTVAGVLWGGPAFKAGLAQGVKVLAVNGQEFDGDVLKDAIKAAKTSSNPIELIVKDQDRYRVVRIEYHGGLRYPHLVRDPAAPARLDDILTKR